MATAAERSAHTDTQAPSVLPDRELFTRLHSGEEPRARELLIERYLPLARRLARRYQHTDEPNEDLVQVASIGLLKAVDRFDCSRDVMFSSYAVPTILGELKRHFRDRTWSVRVPRDLQELALRVDQTVTRLSHGRRHSPTVGEIARAVEASEEQVLEAMEAMGAYRASSLDVPRSVREEESETVAESIGSADDGYDRAEERATLAPLMASITERERIVLRLRFADDLTQAEIGERIGVSQMQVSRLIRQAVARLRASVDTVA
ncbi:MAG TPA: SigB/SigF/SigG family RNA polymerase sigma factor [Solirubrobacteraceae bacterium]|jgi:RNA polymerase sigma-B factor